MDVHKVQELSELASHQIRLAETFADKRKKAGGLKTELELMVTSKLKEIRTAKKNVGYDMALLMLLEILPEAQPIYREYRDAEDDYKGLEKLIEAHQTKISFEQSVMKYIGQGEKYGG